MSTTELQEFNSLVRQGVECRKLFHPGSAVSREHPDLKEIGKASLWAVSGDDYFPCEETVNNLPAGHYIIKQDSMRGIYFRYRNLSTDSLIELPDCASEDVIKEIEKFWKLEDHFREFNFLWKRGMLLWGPPGSGKTSTLQILTKRIIKNDGLAISIYDPLLAVAGLHLLRKIEPVRPIIGLLEDIDAIIQQHSESDLLALLDGENQIDNVVYLATTNYPERLDPRFVNRPSRFDVIKKIGMPTPEARTVYLSAKSKVLNGDKRKLQKWVQDTNGFSVAHLKELVISVEVFGTEYNESLDRLKTMMEINLCSDMDKTPEIGFNVKRDMKPKDTPCDWDKIVKEKTWKHS